MNRPTAGTIRSIRITRPAPQAASSDHFSSPKAWAPPSRIRATGERMQSMTARATRREFASLIFRKALASSMLTVRQALSPPLSGTGSACSRLSLSR